MGEIQSRKKAGFDDWRLSKGKERSRDEMQALGAALIASLLGKCCCTARAAACPQAPGAQFAMYREVRDLDKEGLRWWRSSIRPHRGPISGGGVVFCVSLLLCFLPNSDGLSDDDDPRLAGGQLELLQSMPNVASVMCSPPYLSTPCPLRRRQSPWMGGRETVTSPISNTWSSYQFLQATKHILDYAGYR